QILDFLYFRPSSPSPLAFRFTFSPVTATESCSPRFACSAFLAALASSFAVVQAGHLAANHFTDPGHSLSLGMAIRRSRHGLPSLWASSQGSTRLEVWVHLVKQWRIAWHMA
ncbi:hypothetical protein BDZ85DRAFT_312536, partial [Elsinoe ampelina]